MTEAKKIAMADPANTPNMRTPGQDCLDLPNDETPNDYFPSGQKDTRLRKVLSGKQETSFDNLFPKKQQLAVLPPGHQQKKRVTHRKKEKRKYQISGSQSPCHSACSKGG